MAGTAGDGVPTNPLYFRTNPPMRMVMVLSAEYQDGYLLVEFAKAALTGLLANASITRDQTADTFDSKVVNAAWGMALRMLEATPKSLAPDSQNFPLYGAR